MLIEGFGGSIHETVQNIAHTPCLRRFHQNLIDVTKERHLPVAIRMIWINQRLVVVRDPFLRIGSNQRFVKELPLFMTDIWN